MDDKMKLKILRDLVLLETVNDNENRVTDYLIDFFIKNGININQIQEITYKKKRKSLVVDINNNEQRILAFTGHEDVVEPGNPKLWIESEKQPFSGHIKKGKLFGRGSSDMKSGLAAQAIALVELNNEPNFKGHIRFMATIGEEIGMFGAEQLSDNGFVDDVEALVVGEPSTTTDTEVINNLIDRRIIPITQPNPKKFGRHLIYSAHKGSLNYSVKSYGKSVHSSIPQLGENAIDQLIAFYNLQQDYFKIFENYSNDLLGKTIPVSTIISGGNQPNTVPDFAQLTVKIRTIPEYLNFKIERDLQNLINILNNKGANLSLDISSNNFPVYTKTDSYLSNLVRKTHQEIWHEESLVVGSTGGTDAAKFVERNPKLEVVIIGPGNETAHQVDEFVYVDDYLKYIDIYKSIAIKYFE